MHHILVTLFLAFGISLPSFVIADNFQYTSNNVKIIRNLQLLNVPSQSPSSANSTSTFLSVFSDKNHSNTTTVNFSNRDTSFSKADKTSHSGMESIMGLSLSVFGAILFFTLSTFFLISTKRKKELVQEESSQSPIEGSTIQASASTCCNQKYFFTRSSIKEHSKERKKSTKPNKEEQLKFTLRSIAKVAKLDPR